MGNFNITVQFCIAHLIRDWGLDPNGTNLRGILEVVFMSPLQGFVF